MVRMRGDRSIPRLQSIFLSALLLIVQRALSLSLGGDPPRRVVTVSVCTNKDCRQSGGGSPLVSAFRSLLPPDNGGIVIEPSGCLSQCGKGPNVSCSDGGVGGGDGRLFTGVGDVTTASAILDVVAPDVDFPIALLVAASKIRECQGCPATRREGLLTEAITAMSKDGSEGLERSFAFGFAHCLRAEARLDSSDGEGALSDVRVAVDVLPDEGKVWRVLARCEEEAGNVSAAIDALCRWRKVDVASSTKANNEIARLRADASY